MANICERDSVSHYNACIFPFDPSIRLNDMAEMLFIFNVYVNKVENDGYTTVYFGGWQCMESETTDPNAYHGLIRFPCLEIFWLHKHETYTYRVYTICVQTHDKNLPHFR